MGFAIQELVPAHVKTVEAQRLPSYEARIAHRVYRVSNLEHLLLEGHDVVKQQDRPQQAPSHLRAIHLSVNPLLTDPSRRSSLTPRCAYFLFQT